MLRAYEFSSKLNNENCAVLRTTFLLNRYIFLRTFFFIESIHFFKNNFFLLNKYFFKNNYYFYWIKIFSKYWINLFLLNKNIGYKILQRFTCHIHKCHNIIFLCLFMAKSMFSVDLPIQFETWNSGAAIWNSLPLHVKHVG